MKAKSLFIYCTLALLLSSVGFYSFQERTIPVMKDSYFYPGEKYVYDAHYGPVSAGRATVHLNKKLSVKDGKPAYKVEIKGETTGMFAYTMEVLDYWTSYIDTATLLPIEFHRDLAEGPKYKLKEENYFKQDSNKVRVISTKPHRPQWGTKDQEFESPYGTQDMVSGYYYLRRIDYDKLEEGELITMPAFLEDSVYNFKVRYNGLKDVYTNYGKLKAHEMSPILPPNDIFTDSNAVRFYISNNEYRVPLKIEADLYFMGAIELELIKYSGTDMKLGKGKSSSWF